MCHLFNNILFIALRFNNNLHFLMKIYVFNMENLNCSSYVSCSLHNQGWCNKYYYSASKVSPVIFSGNLAGNWRAVEIKISLSFILNSVVIT